MIRKKKWKHLFLFAITFCFGVAWGLKMYFPVPQLVSFYLLSKLGVEQYLEAREEKGQAISVKQTEDQKQVHSFVFSVEEKKDQSVYLMNDFTLNTKRLNIENSSRVALFEVNKNLLKFVNQDDSLLLSRLNISLSKIRDNGGIKAIFKLGGTEYALVGYAVGIFCARGAIFNLESGVEEIRFPCLPDFDLIDFNGLGGGSLLNKDGSVLIAIGTPTRYSKKINELAQDEASPYGKVLKLSRNRNSETINYDIFALGLRNPQGLLFYDGLVFSVEHGPRGGDEVNILSEGKNYGWPIMSYGTHYGGERISKTDSVENKSFEPPLYSFTPSIGISSISQCPKDYQDYYSPLRCILISSLRAQSLFFLLIHKSRKAVVSVEQVPLGARIRRISVTGDEIFSALDGEGFLNSSIKLTDSR